MGQKESKIYGNGDLKPPKIFEVKLTKEQLFDKNFRKNLDDNYDRQGYDSGLDFLFSIEIEGFEELFLEECSIQIETNCKAINEKNYVSTLTKVKDDYFYRQKYVKEINSTPIKRDKKIIKEPKLDKWLNENIKCSKYAEEWSDGLYKKRNIRWKLHYCYLKYGLFDLRLYLIGKREKYSRWRKNDINYKKF